MVKFIPAYCEDHKPSQMICVWCLLISCLFYLTAAVNTASAATYYLDAQNGDDTNAGTSGQPWKTLYRAYTWYAGEGTKVQEGDTVLFRDGNYGEFRESTVDSGASHLFYRNDWITYKADEGHEPTLTGVYIFNKDYWGGAGDGSSYLVIDGFDITNTGAHIQYTNYVKILNCDITIPVLPYEGFYAPYVEFGGVIVLIREANYITIENNNIAQGFRAIGMKETNNYYITIKNNTIHFLGEDGMNCKGDHLLIEGNYIYDIRKHRTAAMVYGTKTGTFIQGETVIQAGSGAEGVVDDWYVLGYLTVYRTTETSFQTGDVNFVGQDSGAVLSNITKVDPTHTDGIQFDVSGLTDIIIRGNILWREAAGEGAQGLKLETRGGTLDDVEIENNVIWAEKPIIGGEGDVDLIEFNNNTFYASGSWGEGSGIVNEAFNITNMYNNIFGCSSSTSQWTVSNHGNNIFMYTPSFDLDPTELVYFPVENLFVDAANGDFHLAQGSTAIDFGDPIYAPTIDILGNPRVGVPDAGCYESSPIDPNNPPPELQTIGDKFVDENVALIFDVNATDPNGEPITYSAQGLPSVATLDPQTGDFAWTPSYNQAGSYQVTFRASDGNSWDSETITITVNNVNRAPVLGAITDQSVNENALLSIPVEASDPDGETLTYSVSGLPAGAAFASQTLTWTPSYDQAGTYPVTFTADDGQAQDSAAITITVINVNRTPVLAAINNQSVWSDDPLTFTIDATDPDGDTVTYSAGTLPTGATFIGQDFDWTPSQGQMGSYDVTFLASDGQLQDSQMVTITVDVDSLAPTVTNLSPAVGAIQVPLNNLITLDVTDAGKGIEPTSVKIKVKTNSNPNNNTIYFGDTDYYTSPYGDCRRLGTKADYRFVYQATNEMFYYDQMVTITVNATDLAGNVMNEYSYSFATEMHSFGQNKQVNSGLDNNDRPVTVCDSSGSIWTAWHAGSIGNRDIYISKLTAGEENFGGTLQLTDNTNDQCNPALALDSNDKLYVVWQDNREGDWDIYLSTSVDGISWSTETRVNDPNEDNQVNPAIAIDGQSPNQAHVVWQDGRAGNQDICIATSSDDFATKTVTQITTDSFDQVEPAVTADSDNTIYVVWTDVRNGSNDIYGAASNNPWTNVAIVSNANNQSSPAIAAESTGSILHLLWVDDTFGDNDIYYTSSNGLPGSPLTGSSIIDDSSGADQLEPTIAVTGSTGNNLKVFACWQDWRNTDTDLYFAELISSSGTNVFVGDGGSSTYQGEPIIGIDEYSHPYLIWADNRSTNTEIYYAGSTFVEPVELASELVAASAPSSTTVGADPQAITTVEDVSVVVPAGACSYDVDITVTKIANPQTFAAPCLGSYDFGPSGIQFSQPVTITIPYSVSEANGSTLPYWYNSLTGTLSQQGITNIQDIVISPTLHALSFETTHFTAFYLLGGGAGVLGGGGGGGCSLSAGGEGNMVEFVLPYIGLVLVVAILKVRDARERKARTRNMTAGKI